MGAKLGEELLGCLLLPENVLVLQDILSYHYTYGQVLAGGVTDGQVITMANGKDITIVFISDGVFINEKSEVYVTGVPATNGVIHAIDSVLVPPGLDVEGFLATSCPVPSPAPSPAPTPACDLDVTFSGGCPKQSDENTGPIVVTLDTSSTDDQVKPVRLLDIFVYTRQEPIDYPQVAGTILEPGEVLEFPGVPTVDQSARTRYEFFVHVFGETLNGTQQCSGGVTLDCIVDIPATANNLGFTTLVAALQAAEMEVSLSDPPNPGPLTVFAPSNEAFAKLGDELLGCLLQPENVPVLQEILLYHVTNGKVLAGVEEFGVTNDQMITMANGKDININIISGGVFINGNSAVEGPDVPATNGVIHVIDTVLVPPGLDVTGFLETCLATDPPVPAPTTPLTLAPQPEPTPARTPSPTTKSSKKGRSRKPRRGVVGGSHENTQHKYDK